MEGQFMSETYKEVIVLVEGQTENIFIETVLKPFLQTDNIYLTPTILSKPGQRGGDVKFNRAKGEIRNHLKQRNDTWVTTMVDYYGLDKNWPGYSEAQNKNTNADKAKTIKTATLEGISELCKKDKLNERRFIPYFSMHEFEALLFSDVDTLSQKLIIDLKKIRKIVKNYGGPESINNNKNTCPSAQIKKLKRDFRKTTIGIDIIKAIGVEKISQACPLFGGWIGEIKSKTM